jgi:hypothetical protein
MSHKLTPLFLKKELFMVTDKQVKKLFKIRRMGMTQEDSANKSNMDVKTARKYLKEGKLPSQLRVKHTWRTRRDPFKDVWGEVKEFLENNHGLEAKTIFDFLMREHKGKFHEGQLRTLQRKIKNWRATEGPFREVFFEQLHKPGVLCESDFTDMNELGITICDEPFWHKLYHFILTCSNWETGTVCFSESFESLSNGFQNALWELGGVPREHRTDRLSAAINNLSNTEEFTQRYKRLLAHYKIKGQKTQAESPHENGDIEQSHYRLKKAIAQELMLRGSRNFNSREEYEAFLKSIFDRLNSGRLKKLREEIAKLRELPSKRLEDFTEYTSRVSPGSTIRVQKNTYSVHSRLRGENVTVRLHLDRLEVFYGQRIVEVIPRLHGESKHFIQYRHIIDSLMRKPGAFDNYKYRDCLFPTSYFRIAYDILDDNHAHKKAVREYLQILNMAAKISEEKVNYALKTIIEAGSILSAAEVGRIMNSCEDCSAVPDISIPDVDLAMYDRLIETTGAVQ